MYSDKSNLEIGRLTSAGCSSSPAALSFCCSIFCSANVVSNSGFRDMSRGTPSLSTSSSNG
nr:hypothetical protein [Bacillus velezensis]